MSKISIVVPVYYNADTLMMLYNDMKEKILILSPAWVAWHAYSATSDSLRPHGLQPTKHLCLWNFPGKNTGVGFHFLLQGIFLTQGSKSRLLHLLHWQKDSSLLSHLGKPCT